MQVKAIPTHEVDSTTPIVNVALTLQGQSRTHSAAVCKLQFTQQNINMFLVSFVTQFVLEKVVFMSITKTNTDDFS